MRPTSPPTTPRKDLVVYEVATVCGPRRRAPPLSALSSCCPAPPWSGRSKVKVTGPPWSPSTGKRNRRGRKNASPAKLTSKPATKLHGASLAARKLHKMAGKNFEEEGNKDEELIKVHPDSNNQTFNRLPLATLNTQSPSSHQGLNSQNSSRFRETYPAPQPSVAPLAIRRQKTSSASRSSLCDGRRVTWFDEQIGRASTVIRNGRASAATAELNKEELENVEIEAGSTVIMSTGVEIKEPQIFPGGKAEVEDGAWWWDSAWNELTTVTPMRHGEGSCWKTDISWSEELETCGVGLLEMEEKTPVKMADNNREEFYRQHCQSVYVNYSAHCDDVTPTHQRVTVDCTEQPLQHWDPLVLDAASRGHADIVRTILAFCHADRTTSSVVNCQCPVSGNTALHLAVAGGYSSIVSDLVTFGANVNALNKDGRSALHLAARYGRKRCCRMLLQSGTNPDHKDMLAGETALHIAIRHDVTGVVESLLAYNCRINVQNDNGSTALHFAASFDRRKSLKLLLRTGLETRTEILNERGQTALDVAVEKRHLAAIALLTRAESNRSSTLRNKPKMATNMTSGNSVLRIRKNFSVNNGALVIVNKHPRDVIVTSSRSMSSSLKPPADQCLGLSGHHELPIREKIPASSGAGFPAVTDAVCAESENDCSCCEFTKHLIELNSTAFSSNASFII